MKNNIYHIGFGVNGEYGKYAGVLMTNIVMIHLNQPVHFHIVYDDGLYEEDIRRFNKFAMLYKNVKISFYDGEKILNRLNPISSNAAPRLHRSVLLRILLPSLISKDIDRILYMDVDMLCIKRLDELWAMDMKEKIVAGAAFYPPVEKIKRFNLNQDKFLAGGFLFINAKLWNKNRITEKVLDFYQKNSEILTGIEEDALNTVLKGNFLDIGERFNCHIEVNNPLSARYDKDTVVLHFFMESKSWTKGCIPEIHEMYWKYVRLSLWNDLEMKEPSTVKAAFLAGVTAELNKNYKEAEKYYKATCRKLIEHYVEKGKTWLFNNNIDILKK